MIKSTEPGAHAAGSPHGVGDPQRFAACRRRRAERRGRRCGRPRCAAQAEGAQGRAAGAPVRASTGRARACTASVAPARRGPAAAVALHGAACALAQRPAAGRRPPLGRTSTIFRRRGMPFATPWAAPRAVGPDASGQCASFTRLREPLPCLHTSADAALFASFPRLICGCASSSLAPASARYWAPAARVRGPPDAISCGSGARRVGDGARRRHGREAGVRAHAGALRATRLCAQAGCVRASAPVCVRAPLAVRYLMRL